MRSLFLAVALILSGCDDLTSFDVTQDIPPQTIAGSPLPAILDGFFEVPIDLTIQAEIDEMDAGPVDSITLSSLSLTITTPDDDWAFLESCDLFVESTRAGTQLPRVKVATARIPADGTSLRFDPVDDVDLKPYVEEGARMTATATGNQPADDVTYDGRAVFTVHLL